MEAINSVITGFCKDFSSEEIQKTIEFLRDLENLRIPEAEKTLGSLSEGYFPLSGFSAVRAYFDLAVRLDIGSQVKQDSVYGALKVITAAELLRFITDLTDNKADKEIARNITSEKTDQVSETVQESVQEKVNDIPCTPAPEVNETVVKEKKRRSEEEVGKRASICRITMSKLCVELIMRSKAYAAVHNNHIITRDYLMEHFGDLLFVEKGPGTCWVRLTGSYSEQKQNIGDSADIAIFEDIESIMEQDGELVS